MMDYRLKGWPNIERQLYVVYFLFTVIMYMYIIHYQ